VANGRPALEGCRGDWNAFFASLRFPSVGPASTPRAANAPAPPSTPAPSPPERTTADAPSVSGAPVVVDDLTLVPAPRWSVRRDARGVHLSPTDARSVEVLQLSLLPSRRASASLQSEFQSSWFEVLATFGAQRMLTVNQTPYDLDSLVRTYRGWEYLKGTGGMRLADGTYNLDLYLIRVGDRVLRAAVIAKDFRDNLLRTNASLNPAYSRAIRRMLFTMKIANQPEAPAPPRLRAGGITGVWSGLAMSYGSIKTQYAIFFDNGTAFFGPMFPTTGLAEIDPVVEQPRTPRYWGTYAMNAEAGVLRMPYGDVPLRKNGSALTFTTNNTPHRFIRLDMPATPSLEGTWCLSGGACLRFDSAGRFQDNGAARIVEHALYAFPTSPTGGQGRYELRDYTLILRYDQGPEFRVAFPGLVDGRLTNEFELSFNNDVLVRR
jgi:hypothetical protein